MAAPTKSTKFVYYFGQGKAEGGGHQRELLGGKGAGLAEMTSIGLPVPAGFTITTDACAAYLQRRGKWPSGLENQVRQDLGRLEKACKQKLGARQNPLLVSVRSGAARSMPGMMETILNLGLNDESVEGLAEISSSRRFAFDSYRRLIMMYGSTARGIERERFDEAFERVKNEDTQRRLGRPEGQKVLDTDVNAEELESVVDEFKDIYRSAAGESFPQDPFEQLVGAINAVFDSWWSDKAVTYRRVENITGLNGTAVNICRMVFGNMGDDCGTGVCFTRDPSTGENTYYGDMLINAQGEDVVAGVRTPVRLDTLKSLMPDVYDQLEAVRVMLEVHYKDMQDLEFTIERNKLYMLQCRTGKRSPVAAFKIAVDQATSGVIPRAFASKLARRKYLPKRYSEHASKPIISRDEAIQRITGEDIERLFHPIIDLNIPLSELESRELGEGINAVPGAASGEVVFTAEDAERRADGGTAVILVRKETSPEDVGGMHAATGILTATGGKTSHAAVVARGWGKCCIVGCEELTVDYEDKSMSLNSNVIREGEWITLDGGSGSIYEGRLDLVRPAAPPEYDTLMRWCDRRRTMKVRTNADAPADAARAIGFGAEGIGLCRTEHMFFDPAQPQRIRAMREMILSDSEQDRRRALDKLLPYQRGDFEGIFEAMNGLPVTIRLVDPPLHEFLPHRDNPKAQQDAVDDLNASTLEELSRIGPFDTDRRRSLESQLVTLEDVQLRVDQLREANPMLGHRGCRLCITYPEILEMQVRAIIEAAVACKRRGVKVLPEIMIPLSIDAKELRILVDRARAVANAILKEQGVRLKCLIGTMVETPRAALLADKMAGVAEFFSFGTNDLTQLTLALSRDDAGRFLPDYVNEDKAAIFADHPFQSIDVDGVGTLVEWAVQEGRASRPGIKLGVCGEHGGDPASIRFFQRAGLDYVSCSPFRVPVARLVAAQAAIESPARSTKPASGRKRSVSKAKKTPGATGKTKRTAKKAGKKRATARAKTHRKTR